MCMQPPKRHDYSYLEMYWFLACKGDAIQHIAVACGATTHSQTQLTPHALYLILSNESNHGVRSNAEIIRWESSPEARNASSPHLLHRTIDGPFKWHLTCHWIGFHLLNLRLNEVERQAEERCE